MKKQLIHKQPQRKEEIEDNYYSIEMFWGEDEFQIVYLNEAEFNLAFCCIDEISEDAEIISKKAIVYDFDKHHLSIAKQLEQVINKRDVSIFRN